MNNPFHIMIFDPFPVFGCGIKSVLEKEAVIFIDGVEHSVKEMNKKLRKNLPDLLIITSIHATDGCIPFITRLRAIFPELHLFVITSHESSLYVEELLNLQVEGIAFCNMNSDDMVKAVHRVLSGLTYFPAGYPKRSTSVIKGGNPDLKGKDKGPVPPLSKRETEVLKLISQGKTCKEIATLLYISSRTVETHKDHIEEKLNLHTTAEIIRYALINNLV